MAEILLITISGHDQPGLTSAFAHALAGSGAIVTHMRLAFVHACLVLGAIGSDQTADRMKAVEEGIAHKAWKLGVTARINLISEQHYRGWIRRQHNRRFIVPLLAPQFSAAQLAAVTGIFLRQNLNIDIMDRLSARGSAADPTAPRMCIEFTISGDHVDGDGLRRELLTLADEAD